MPEELNARKPGAPESDPPAPTPPAPPSAPPARMTPRALADYLAAVHRPAPGPHNRGLTPAAVLAVADWLDAQRAMLSAGAEGGAP